jgi:hypothetical protein
MMSTKLTPANFSSILERLRNAIHKPVSKIQLHRSVPPSLRARRDKPTKRRRAA